MKKFFILFYVTFAFSFLLDFAVMKKCFLSLFLAWTLLGCSTQPPSQVPIMNLRYGIPQAPVSLDPATETDLMYYQIVFNIFETLIALDWEKGIYTPKLATSWQSDSARIRWTFSLRQGVVFHDGSPLNAEAIKISLGRQFDINNPFYRRDQTDIYGLFAFSMIKEIRAVNDSTVEFILKYPYAAFLDNLATPIFAAIASPRALKEFGEKFGHHPVGTGPFQFESWGADSQIVIKKFQPYWGKPPQIDSVIYKIIPSLEEKLQKLKNGELEVISGLSAAKVSDLYLTPGVKVMEMGLVSTVFLGFNCQAKPFSKVETRRAIAHALDKKSIVYSVSRGLATIARGPLPPIAMGYDTTLASPKYDPQVAKNLLQSSGYYNSSAVVALHYFTHTDTVRGDFMAHAMKADLENIGMAVQLVPYTDWEIYRKSVLFGGKSQFFRDGWMGYTRHPDNFLYPLFHSKSAHNFFKYKNPEVDSLLEQARRTPDEPTQRVLYRRIQEIILEDVPAVFISHPKAVYAIRDRVKNFRVDPLAIPWLNEVRLEDEK